MPRPSKANNTAALVAGSTETADLLVGMKAICRYIGGVSEATALKYHRELDMPMRKSDKNGTSGQWMASKTKLNEWSRGLLDAP